MKKNADAESMVHDDDMRPEYDFSRGLRGVHAYRFSKLSSDEALILGYWQGRGFEVGSFAKSEMGHLKTPDFRLSRRGLDVALCEVKSLQKDTWLEEQMKSAPAGEIVGGLRRDPVYNRISNAIYTASEQFRSVNAAHSLFNFLVLVNHDTGAESNDLVSVLTGYWDPLHGSFERTHTHFSEGRIRDEKENIDLYVWSDIRRDGSVGEEFLYFRNPETRMRVCELLEIDPKRIKDVPPAA
jgi:hypothetical protein